MYLASSLGFSASFAPSEPRLRLALLPRAVRIEPEATVNGEAMKNYLRVKEEGALSLGLVLDAIKTCGASGDLQAAGRIYSDVVQTADFREPGTWDPLIASYLQNGDPRQAMEAFTQMQDQGGAASRETFLSAIRACACLGDRAEDVKEKTESSERAKALHRQIIEAGQDKDTLVANALVEMYARCSGMEEASKVFEAMNSRDVVSWNSMILGYAHNGEGTAALEVYERMKREGNPSPNPATIVAALRACCKMTESERARVQDGKMTAVESLKKARLVHSDATELGLEQDLGIANTLLETYGRCGKMGDARSLFERLQCRDVVTWNCMITGYGQTNEPEQALNMYKRMQSGGSCPPSIGTFTSALRACVNLSFMEAGRKIHQDIKNAALESNTTLVSSLVEFYVRCGQIADAQEVFGLISRPGLPAWNSLMAGYNRKGNSKLALDLFERMKRDGVRPDGETFRVVLRACNELVLVDLGRKYLNSMEEEYGMLPSDVHYASMIELYGREGRLDEAMSLVLDEYFPKNRKSNEAAG